MQRVVYLTYAPELYDVVREALPAGFELVALDRDSDGLRQRLLPQADAILMAETALPGEWIAQAARLKLIQHQGVGYEKIDVEAARQRGIPVCLTPEGTTIGVAEHTILLILAVYKRLVEADRRLRQGEFLMWALRRGSFELAGKTLGLVGMGRIGRAVARRALAFDAKVQFYDPVVAEPPAPFSAELVRPVSFGELLETSDIVSLHCPSTPETRGLMNRETLGRMKRGAVLINTCRGNVVVEKDLVEALERGALGGAGLDVFEREPVARGNRLLGLENVVLTPHIAAGSIDALRAKMRAVGENLARFARGERLRHVVGVDIE